MCDMEEAVRNQDASHLNLEYTKDVMDIMSQLRKEWKMQYPGENGKDKFFVLFFMQ